VASFKAGSVDALGGLAPDAADAATSGAGTRVVRYPWASLTAVALNQRASHPEFQSAGVRQALLSAIDRPTILTSVLRGRGSIADAPLPSWSAAYDKAAINVTPFSNSTAQAGLAAAGWVHDATGWTLPHGTSPYTIRLLTLDEVSNPIAYRVAQQVATDWRALGLNVTLQPVAAATYTQRLEGADFDAAVVDYRLGLDPDVSSLFLSTQVSPAGSNLTGVQDQGLDRLLANVRTTTDPTDRQTAVSALEKYVTTNVLMLPICFADYEFVVSDRVQGLSPNEIADPSDRFWDVLDWRLASDG
jgi:peptide/nickel transport system substrate-binding protein